MVTPLNKLDMNNLTNNNMTDITIAIEKGTYFSDIPELATATNCMIMKRITGLGFSHAMLTNSKNVILVVPLISIAESKQDKAFCFVGALHADYATRKESLMTYLQGEGAKKIICTPELLPELSTYINADDYTLALDEIDMAVSHATFRESMPKMLDTFETWQGDKVCCSATFVEFSRRSMQLLPRITVAPNYEYKNSIKMIPTNSVNSLVQEKVEETDNKIAVFINDSKAIISIITNLGLTSKECQVLAGASVKGAVKEALGEGYIGAFTKELTTKVTFLTKAYVAGNDIMTKGVEVIVASNPIAGNHMMFSMNETIQALGRFRNGYTNASFVTCTSDKLEDEYVSRHEDVESAYTMRDTIVGCQNSKLKIVRLQGNKILESITKGEDNICLRTDTLDVNYEAVDNRYADHNTLMAHKSIRDLSIAYSSELNIDADKYVSVGKFKMSWSPLKVLKDLLLDEDDNIITDAKEVIAKIEAKGFKQISAVKDLYDFIVTYPKALEEVKAIKHIRQFSNFKARYTEGLNRDRLMNQVTKHFKSGQVYKASEVIAILSGIYVKCNIDKKAKSTDLSTYIDCTFGQARVDGKTSKVVTIK